MSRPLQMGAGVRCSSYRCGRETTSSYTVRASWLGGRSAWRGFWVRVPHPGPRRAPPAPPPRAFCSGEAPEEAAGATSWLGLRGGRGGRRTPASVSGRASPLTRQLLAASPSAPLLGGLPSGGERCLHGPRVGRKFQLLGLHYGDEAQAGIGALGPSCLRTGGPEGHGGSLWPGAE